MYSRIEQLDYYDREIKCPDSDEILLNNIRMGISIQMTIVFHKYFDYKESSICMFNSFKKKVYM